MTFLFPGLGHGSYFWENAHTFASGFTQKFQVVKEVESHLISNEILGKCVPKYLVCSRLEFYVVPKLELIQNLSHFSG